MLGKHQVGLESGFATHWGVGGNLPASKGLSFLFCTVGEGIGSSLWSFLDQALQNL